jgi:hypothetical protein
MLTFTAAQFLSSIGLILTSSFDIRVELRDVVATLSESPFRELIP